MATLDSETVVEREVTQIKIHIDHSLINFQN